VTESATPLPPPGDFDRLVVALRDRDSQYGSRCAAMYVGAISVVGQTSNPERFAHAAQSMRELLEKLPLFYDGSPQQAPGAKASDHLLTILAEYDEAQKRSDRYDKDAGLWGGEIDAVLQRLFVQIDEIAVIRRRGLTRRDIARRFARDLDPRGAALPAPREDALAKEWIDHNGFFNAVAHHGKYPTDREFEARLHACTRLLIEYLAPDVLGTIALLDQIIEETE
jgi:hypothetical protein